MAPRRDRNVYDYDNVQQNGSHLIMAILTGIDEKVSYFATVQIL